MLWRPAELLAPLSEISGKPTRNQNVCFSIASSMLAAILARDHVKTKLRKRRIWGPPALQWRELSSCNLPKRRFHEQTFCKLKTFCTLEHFARTLARVHACAMVMIHALPCLAEFMFREPKRWVWKPNTREVPYGIASEDHLQAGKGAASANACKCKLMRSKYQQHQPS